MDKFAHLVPSVTYGKIADLQKIVIALQHNKLLSNFKLYTYQNKIKTTNFILRPFCLS